MLDLYLIYIVTFAFSSFVQNKPIVGEDAAGGAVARLVRTGGAALSQGAGNGRPPVGVERAADLLFAAVVQPD